MFDKDAQMQPYVKGKKALLVHGDALKADDVRHAWQAALEAGQGKVDFVLFTVGMCLVGINPAALSSRIHA